VFCAEIDDTLLFEEHCADGKPNTRPKQVKSDIQQVVVKTILSSLPANQHAYKVNKILFFIALCLVLTYPAFE
jgi:hypothetical protein